MFSIQKRPGVLGEGLDRQKSDSDEDVVRRGGSKRRSDSKERELKLSALTLETVSTSRDDYSIPYYK